MAGNQGGVRPGAGRKSGSKNKMTIAREAVAVIINADNPQKLASAIHQRGHELLSEMERIALDPTQPVAARIMAAKSALIVRMRPACAQTRYYRRPRARSNVGIGR